MFLTFFQNKFFYYKNSGGKNFKDIKIERFRSIRSPPEFHDDDDDNLRDRKGSVSIWLTFLPSEFLHFHLANVY